MQVLRSGCTLTSYTLRVLWNVVACDFLLIPTLMILRTENLFNTTQEDDDDDALSEGRGISLEGSTSANK